MDGAAYSCSNDYEWVYYPTMCFNGNCNRVIIFLFNFDGLVHKCFCV
jgi:hypothetical protein